MRVPPPGRRTVDDPTLVNALFAGRRAESVIFERALHSFVRYVRESDDPGRSRNNVLVFHGLGGIGKTSLSLRLERWTRGQLPLVNGWGQPPTREPVVTVRIDLHESGTVDVVSTVIAMRLALGRVKRSWPAFDLAFAAYWSSAHPGEPLPELSSGHDFGNAINDTLVSILGDLGAMSSVASGGTRAVRTAIERFRSSRARRLAFASFEGYGDFLERCLSLPTRTDPQYDLLCDIYGVLAWELGQIDEQPLVVVFVDAVERLGLDSRRLGERRLNQIVFNLPNVLFVLTGRDPITWYSAARLDLPVAGPEAWPGLMPDALLDSRQHPLGKLSPEDATEVILRARKELALPISGRTIVQLVKASGGLPLYLKLALQIATNARDGGGRSVTVEDISGSLDELVARVFDDIPSDEQRALRAACLFTTFDVQTMAATAGVDVGCARRAVERPMVEEVGGARFSYRIHDEIRRAVRVAGHDMASGWSHEDWMRAAEMALNEAERRYVAARHVRDRPEVMHSIGMAVTVLSEVEVSVGGASTPNYDDWLSQAIAHAPSMQGLRQLIPTTAQTSYGRHVMNLLDGRNVDFSFDDRVALLRQTFDSRHPLSMVAGRHLSYLYKQRSNWDAALSVQREVIARQPDRINLIQPAFTLLAARRFRQAVEAVTHLGEPNLIRRQIDYIHGDPGTYFAEVEGSIRGLAAKGRDREVIEETATLLMRRVFFSGDVSRDLVLEHLEECQLVGNGTAMRDLIAALILIRDPRDNRPGLLNQLRAMDGQVDGEIGFRWAMAELADSIVCSDEGRLEQLATQLSTRPIPRSRGWITVESQLEGLGYYVRPEPTEWIVEREEVVRRWKQHLEAYVRRQQESASD